MVTLFTTAIKDRSFLEIVGFLAVICLLMANAFHFIINQYYIYYREVFGFFFVGLSLTYMAKRAIVSRSGPLLINRPLFYLLLFPLLLTVWSFIDPGVDLYGNFVADRVSMSISKEMLILYVLRNSLLYLPLVIYLFQRGLNKQEITFIAIVITIVSPISIVYYLQHNALVETTLMLDEVFTLAGRGISYNSYVPYLTFSVLCGMYLIFSERRLLIKLVSIACVSFSVLFIIFSTSRQSILFVVMSFFAYVYFNNKSNEIKISHYAYIIIMVASVIMLYLFFTQGVDADQRFINKLGGVSSFFSDEDSRRVTKAVEGFSMLTLREKLMGAGLTSVVNGGPHNDYVRWVQRIGIPLMIIGFMPFVLIFNRCIHLLRTIRNDNTFYVFLGLSVGFTLFHSLFGYPRDDAYQAPVVYLGLGLWFGAYRNRIIPKFYSLRSTNNHNTH